MTDIYCFFCSPVVISWVSEMKFYKDPSFKEKRALTAQRKGKQENSTIYHCRKVELWLMLMSLQNAFLHLITICKHFPSFQDERFNREVDVQTGYRTKALLCMPIKDAAGDVIGVAQVINKHGSDQQSFTSTDEKVSFKFLFLINKRFWTVIAQKKWLDVAFFRTRCKFNCSLVELTLALHSSRPNQPKNNQSKLLLQQL